MRSYYGSLYGSCPVKSAGLKSTPPNSSVQLAIWAHARARPRAAGVCMRAARSNLAFRWGRNGFPLSPRVRARVAVGSMVTEHPPRKRPS